MGMDVSWRAPHSADGNVRRGMWTVTKIFRSWWGRLVAWSWVVLLLPATVLI
jgi:hypothetical protein